MKKTDGEKEARLTAPACSRPPEGYSRRTLRMPAGRAAETEIADSVPAAAVRRTSKKNGPGPHLRRQRAVPPDDNAASVSNTEDTPDIYHRPSDPADPLICTDGQPVRLIGERRVPAGAEPGRPFRYDCEYMRKGTAEIFMSAGPPGGRRRVSVRDSKKGIGRADEMRQLPEEDYPDAGKTALICDNYSARTAASFYKKFPPEQARNLIKRPDIHRTPKHGSRLGTAETGPSAPARR